MNKVNIKKFQKNICKDSTGMILSPPHDSIYLLWQYIVSGYYSIELQYADVTASIIFILFIFWKILKPASYMKVMVIGERCLD